MTRLEIPLFYDVGLHLQKSYRSWFHYVYIYSHNVKRQTPIAHLIALSEMHSVPINYIFFNHFPNLLSLLLIPPPALPPLSSSSSTILPLTFNSLILATEATELGLIPVPLL